MTPVLHYIYDPLCGWCYGAAPLVRAARQVITVVAHGGGMMTGSQRQTISPAFRNFVLPHDQRIAAATGQPFGAAYFDGLLREDGVALDSASPIAAVLAAGQLAGRELDLLARLQTAHYVEGRRICEPAVQAELAREIGLDAARFNAVRSQSAGLATEQHIAQSRALLAQVGGRGFPAFSLALDGRYEVLDIANYLGKPAEWQQRLSQGMASSSPSATLSAMTCKPESCAR